MSLIFNLIGNTLMVANTDNSSQNLQNLTILQSVTKQYASNDNRREALDSNALNIYFIQGPDGVKYECIEENYGTIHHKLFEFLHGRGTVPYMIMYKHGVELIVCELSIPKEEKQHPFWRVIRTHNYNIREIDYLIETMRKAKVYILGFDFK